MEYHYDVFRHAFEGLKGSDQKLWLERIQLEINNLRIALEWAFEPPGDEVIVTLGSRILRAIQTFWAAKGLFQESLTWYEKALTHQEKITDLEQNLETNFDTMLRETEKYLDLEAFREDIKRERTIGEAKIREIRGQAFEAMGLVYPLKILTSYISTAMEELEKWKNEGFL